MFEHPLGLMQEVSSKSMWYKHMVESIIENDIMKILWDVCIQVNTNRTPEDRYCGYGKKYK